MRNSVRWFLCLIVIACLLAIASTDACAQLDLDGLTLVQEGPAAASAGDAVPDNLALAGTPFATSELGPEIGTPYHFIDNLNDGSYGNAFSWIGGDELLFDDVFAGIDLGATPIANIQSIAFGRSNVLSGDVCGAGVCTDRTMGLYILQYTQVPSPGNNLELDTTGNPTSGWVDIGTLSYGQSDGPDTLYNNIWQRHRYNFEPVDATGVRLLMFDEDEITPSTGLAIGNAIDEIELYDMPGEVVPPPPPPPPIRIAAADGFTIKWDGNEGDFFDETEPPDGSVVPDNAALASQGSEPFSSSDLGPQLGIDFHVVENLNDGFYGNANSWIGGDDNPFAPDAFGGIALSEPLSITSVAWGRDNGNDFADACGGQCTDRSPGTYELQITRVDGPDADTEETGDADTGWQSIGEVTYFAANDEFTPYLRHQFEVGQGEGGINATGFRLVVPRSGLGGGTAIDEIEIYGRPIGEQTCDFNADGVLDVKDINLLREEVKAGTNNPDFDVNKDSLVNTDDIVTFVESPDKLNSYIGDSNLDLEFGSGDLVQVFAGGQYEDGVPMNSTWETGDWNGDGDFDSGDLVLAFSRGGYEQGPRGAAVPEPSSLALLLMALGLVSTLRARHN